MHIIYLFFYVTNVIQLMPNNERHIIMYVYTRNNSKFTENHLERLSYYRRDNRIKTS